MASNPRGRSEREVEIACDSDKVDETVLALLSPTTFEDGPVLRTWKGADGDALDRLHEKGLIGNPKSKAKSVPLTAEGARRSKELFERLFKK